MTINLDNLITVFNIFAGSGGVIGLYLALRTKHKITLSEEAKKRDMADAAQAIVDAAAEQVEVIKDAAKRARDQLREEQAESEKWKNQCLILEGKVSLLGQRVEENHDCQTELMKKLEALEDEKKKLMGRITELEEKIKELQDENKRLKEERENEKKVIA